MIKYAGDMSFLEEKWLQDLVAKVGHQLHTRKKKDILLFEIEKRSSEIEHIEGRIAIARGTLARTVGTIETLQRQLSDSMGESKRLRIDRERAEEEFSRLKDASKDMEQKLAALPQMRAEARNLEREVRRSARQLEALRSDYRDAAHRKERLRETCKASTAEFADIEQETSVMKNTFTLLTGQRPEDFDPGTFEAIQDDLEKKVDEFTNEMLGEIEKIKADTLSLEAQLDDKMGRKKAALLTKRELEEVVAGLKDQVGTERRPEVLEAELERMKRQEQKFGVEIEERKSEIKRFEAASASLLTRTRAEEALGSQLSERHAYLKTRKAEMDQYGNVAEEIQRIKEEARRLGMASQVNTARHARVNELIGDLRPANQALASRIEEYHKRFSEFEQEIERLLAP